MPYREIYVPPELFLTHNGVNVFHAYGDDEYNDKKNFWFTLDTTDNDAQFDLRILDVPARAVLDQHPPYQQPGVNDNDDLIKAWNDWHAGQEERLKAILREAIDAGLLVAGECNELPTSHVFVVRITSELDHDTVDGLLRTCIEDGQNYNADCASDAVTDEARAEAQQIADLEIDVEG